MLHGNVAIPRGSMQGVQNQSHLSLSPELLHGICGFLPSQPLAFLITSPTIREVVECIYCESLIMGQEAVCNGEGGLLERGKWLPQNGAWCGQVFSLKYTLWWIKRLEDAHKTRLAGLSFARGSSIADATDVKHLRGLRWLFMPEATMSNKTLAHVGSCSTIEHLWLRSCRTLTRVDVMSRLHLLKSLNLSLTAVTDDGLHALGECPSLEELDLSGCPFTCALPFLKNMHCLRVLKLCDSGITDRAIYVIGTASMLHQLDISGCFLVTTLNPLRSLTKLKWLNATWCGVRDGGFEGLSGCVGLEYLNMSCCWDIRRAHVLGLLSKLQVLDLRGTNVDDEGLNGLARSGSLSVLYLCGCFYIRSVSMLMTMSSLKEIDVSYTAIPEESLSLLPNWVHVVKRPIRMMSRSASVTFFEPRQRYRRQ